MSGVRDREGAQQRRGRRGAVALISLPGAGAHPTSLNSVGFGLRCWATGCARAARPCNKSGRRHRRGLWRESWRRKQPDHAEPSLLKQSGAAAAGIGCVGGFLDRGEPAWRSGWAQSIPL